MQNLYLYLDELNYSENGFHLLFHSDSRCNPAA